MAQDPPDLTEQEKAFIQRSRWSFFDPYIINVGAKDDYEFENIFEPERDKVRRRIDAIEASDLPSGEIKAFGVANVKALLHKLLNREYYEQKRYVDIKPNSDARTMQQGVQMLQDRRAREGAQALSLATNPPRPPSPVGDDFSDLYHELHPAPPKGSIDDAGAAALEWLDRSEFDDKIEAGKLDRATRIAMQASDKQTDPKYYDYLTHATNLTDKQKRDFFDRRPTAGGKKTKMKKSKMKKSKRKVKKTKKQYK